MRYSTFLIPVKNVRGAKHPGLAEVQRNRVEARTTARSILTQSWSLVFKWLEMPSDHVVFKATNVGKPWHQTDTNAHFFSVSLGHLTLKKNCVCIHISQTESLGEDYVTLSQEVSFLRNDAFQKVRYHDAVGKAKDLKMIIFLRQRFWLWEWKYFPWKPRSVFPPFYFIGNADIIASHQYSNEGGAGKMKNSAGELSCHQGFASSVTSLLPQSNYILLQNLNLVFHAWHQILYLTQMKCIFEQVTEGRSLQLKHRNAATMPVKTGLEDSLASLRNFHITVQHPVKNSVLKIR